MRPFPSAPAVLASLALVILLGGLPPARGQHGVQSIQPLPAVTDSDERFGIANVFPHPHWLNLARNAGMRWNRWEFRWSSIEARQGHYDWGGSDEVIEASRSAGLKVQGILISTPRWAEARAPAGGVIPRGLYEPWDSPGNTWGRFVRTMAERYRGRVHAWEIWNEPDYPRGDFSFWFASKADYYQLLKVAYKAIRSVDPDAPVLVAGLMYWGDPSYLEDILVMARNDPEGPANQYFFDAIAWHIYSRPTDVWDRVQRSRLLLQSYVGHKAIWINEGNLPVWPESRLNNYAPFPLSGTLEEQAAWVVQWYAYALAAGADRVMMYRMHDSDEPEAWGLARPDGSLRPAYVAYQLAARYFSHAHHTARATLGDVEQIVFDRPGQRVVAVWNRTPRPLTTAIGAAAPSALLVAIDGTSQPIAPRDGAYHLNLPPATANTGNHAQDYLVGGPPYLLVEDLAPGLRRYEDTDSLLRWGGRWDVEPLPAASGGTSSASAQPGATVHFAFSGPTVTWYTTRAPRAGVAHLSLNGAPLDEIDLYNPSPVAQAPYTYTDLGPGPHVLGVTVTGKRHAEALGSYVVVDAFVAADARPAPEVPPVVEVTRQPVLIPATTAPISPTPRPTLTPPPATPFISAIAPSATPIQLPTAVTSSASPTPRSAPPASVTPTPTPAAPTPSSTPTAIPIAPASPTMTPADVAPAPSPTPAYYTLPGVPGVLIVPDPTATPRPPPSPFPTRVRRSSTEPPEPAW